MTVETIKHSGVVEVIPGFEGKTIIMVITSDKAIGLQALSKILIHYIVHEAQAAGVDPNTLFAVLDDQAGVGSAQEIDT